jgi:hypothetical protein
MHSTPPVAWTARDSLISALVGSHVDALNLPLPPRVPFDVDSFVEQEDDECDPQH